MPRRPSHKHGIRRGQICDWPEGVDTPDEVAARVTYTGNPIHKTYPSPAGPTALRADEAKCDRLPGNDGPTCWKRFGERFRRIRRQLPRCIPLSSLGIDQWCSARSTADQRRHGRLPRVSHQRSPPVSGTIQNESRPPHMSKSLLLEYDPIDQPASADPVERRTWCTLRIRVGHRFVSRIWDKTIRIRGFIFMCQLSRLRNGSH